MLFRCFQIEDRLVDPLVGLHHGVDGKVLLDPSAASAAVDSRETVQALHRLVDVVHQEAGLSVLDDFTAGAEIHGDHRHAGGVGFRQDQSESLRDGIQVEQRPGLREQRVLARDIHRPEIANRLDEVGLDLLVESMPGPV